MPRRSAPAWPGDAAAGRRGDDVELVGGLGEDERRTATTVRSVSMRSTSLSGCLLIWMSPVPGRRNTRAAALLRRPVP